MERERLRNRYDMENERSQEVNGNSSSFLGKRKKSREKKRCAYLQEWLENSWTFQQTGGSYPLEQEPVDNLMGNHSSYWAPHNTVPVTGQRLFTAVSDPAVCRYSVPVPMGYSLEPISLPLYPVYQSAIPVNTGRPNIKPTVRPSTRGRPPRRSQRGQFPSYPPPVSCDGWQAQRQSSRGMPSMSVPLGNLPQSQPNAEAGNGQDFASLPPVMQSGVQSATQRRFSDPGLGPIPTCSPESDGSSDSNSSRGSSPTTVGLVLNLVEQVNALQDSNRRLFRELHDTRLELEALKLQAASWRQLPSDYEPGMLSDLIREVRDAARVREDALLSRVRGMLGNAETGKWLNGPDNKICNVANTERISSQGSRDIEELKDQLQMALTEKNLTDERLLRVEDQLKNLRLQNSNQTTTSSTSIDNSKDKDNSDEQPLTQQLHKLEKEKLQLRCELQEALTSRKDVEAHAQKLERLVGILRKKINGVTQDEKPSEPVSLEHSPSSLENTSESLVSVGSGSTSTGRSSIHSPQVTMSGPVTDL